MLGTQFNVEQREDYFEVSCYEGLVSVTFNNTTHKLPAGNSIRILDGRTTKSIAPINGQPAWMRNESSFKSVPLYYVLKELERQYGITVTTEKIDTKQLFTGSFSNTDLNLALESISAPTQLLYNINKDKVLIYAENKP